MKSSSQSNFFKLSCSDKKAFLRILLITAFLLLIPFTAMQVSDEVNWHAGDFIVAAVLLMGTGIVILLASKLTKRGIHRLAIALTALTALFLIWVNLAVGIIGNENNPANLIYVLVLLIPFSGAIFSRLQPRIMTKVLFATAIAQALTAIIALTAHLGAASPSYPAGVVLINALFCALWCVAGFLFKA